MCVVFAFCTFGAVANAIDITAYNGNISNTYITYFKSILPNVGFGDNYVVYRVDTNTYEMCVGKLECNNNIIKSIQDEPIICYRINTDSTYNGTINLTNTHYDELVLNYRNQFIYSDLDGFPKLEERGQQYEIIQTFTLFMYGVCVIMLGVLSMRKRK